jgi:endoglucanase
MLSCRSAVTLVLSTVLLAGAAVGTSTAVADPQTAAVPQTASAYRNPVAGYPWGINKGSQNPLWPTYARSTGSTRSLLGKIALRPRARWYSSYIPTSKIASKIHTDVTQEQGGNPRVQVWMALFRLWPNGESSYRKPMSQADMAAYKAWMRATARAIGSTRAAVVLEPDLAVAFNGWRPAVRFGLVRYAAQLLSKLPNTTVYLDASASDWLSVRDATSMLRSAGIHYAHGFALSITHHTSVASEIRYGHALVASLAKSGVRGKHFVVDTSDNGHPYTNTQFKKAHPGRNTNDPIACSAKNKRACVSLGIPPTTDVAAARWKLPAAVRSMAKREVDAYMWIGQPWLSDNTTEFSLPFVKDIVRSSPYR